MKIKVENLGNIEKAELELGNLTILTGKNNTGKTYIAYALYGFLDSWRVLKIKDFEYTKEETKEKFIFSVDIKNNQNIYLNQILSDYVDNKLHNIFNIHKSFFKNTHFRVILTEFNFDFLKNKFRERENYIRKIYIQNDKLMFDFFNKNDWHLRKKDIVNFFETLIKETLFSLYFPKAYIITAERTGIHLFQKELDDKKNDFIDNIKQNINNIYDKRFFDIIKNMSRYSIPIGANITLARNKELYLKNDSDIAENDKKLLQEIEELLGVGYSFQEGSAYLKLENEQALPLYMASTSARALLDLYIYIRHILKKNDLLIIDEPELNLHPEMQMKVARVFAKLVRAGVKILITTHSDYIVKEINNLITLSNDFETKSDLMKHYDYKENEILQPSDVKAYIASDKTLHQVKIDNWGMEKTTFDKSIDLLNEISEEIIYGINQ